MRNLRRDRESEVAEVRAISFRAAGKHRSRAEKRRNEETLRSNIEVFRTARLKKMAAFENADPVPEVERFILVVRDEKGRDGELFLDLPEMAPQLTSNFCVESSKGLVEEENAGGIRERSREGDALELAPGELVGVPAAESDESHEVEQLLPLLRPLGGGDSPDPEPELHVLGDRHVPEDRVVLEHESRPALLRREPSDVAAVDEDSSAVDLREARDQPQDRALSASRRAEQDEELPLGDVERHLIDDRQIPEAFGKAVERNRHQFFLSPTTRPRFPKLRRKKKITNESAASTAATALASAILPASNWAKM